MSLAGEAPADLEPRFWPPMMLPMGGLAMQSAGLQQIICGPGYSLAANWDQALKIAEGVSLGSHNIPLVAKHAEVAETAVAPRLRELCQLYNVRSVPGAIDGLMRDGFLPTDQEFATPDLNPAAQAAVEQVISGQQIDSQEAAEEAFHAVGFPNSPGEFVRAVYEHGLRSPRTFLSTPRIGFHMPFANTIQTAIDELYMPSARSETQEMASLTRAIVSGQETVGTNEAIKNLHLTDLETEVMLLFLLGLDMSRIAQRIPLASARTAMRRASKKIGSLGGQAVARTLFASGTFFVAGN